MRFRAIVRPGLVSLLGLALALFCAGPLGAAPEADGGYAGSASCRSCHEKFYVLWSTSRHGLAMRSYTDALGAALVPQGEALAVGDARYRAFVGQGQGFVRETGSRGERDWPIVQVLGGKNVCYFLTTFEGGRLQTLPVAYDVRRGQWFDTAASGVRHAPRGGERHPPLDWRDPAYTFNTSCHNCHVSQLSTNYDPNTRTYATTWAEPGINCETCHGPSAEHNAVCARAPKGETPKDLKILRFGKDLTTEQRNDSCASCHAKMAPLTAEFSPGQRFFDHFDLILLENPDYYPDGRDLGENFTFTSWLSSPCANSGRLDCVFCHTSSGRFKQAADPDQACLPCHRDKEAGADRHTRHKADSPGSRCVACHMPMTTFAGMRRSDHSMLPPTPAVTAAYGSPNACQGCHQDKDPAWADANVRAWRQRDYQAPVLKRAELVDKARRRDFSDLEAMARALAAPGRDQVFAASLARLLRACPSAGKLPVLRKALGDASPLVRASAASSLGDDRESATVTALAGACADSSRLVRLRAAESLAGAPREGLTAAERKAVENATGELVASFAVRPDDWAGSYNQGNYLLRTGDANGALAAYDQAMRLRPDAAAPCMNAAMAKARLGDLPGAEALLRKARTNDPASAAVAFNLGLVLAERGRNDDAFSSLRRALEIDPTMAEAAYNLGLLSLKRDPAGASAYLRLAASLRPDDQKYAGALRFLPPGGRTPAKPAAQTPETSEDRAP